MRLKFNKLVMFALVAVLASSCGIGLIIRGSAKKSVSVENKTVPADFISKDQTLLVLLWGDVYDDYAIKAFKKFYHGPIEYVGFAELHTEKYSDLDRYSYVFSQGPGEEKMYSGGDYSFSFEGSRPFHMYDRRDKSFYKAQIRSGFFARVIQGYAMKLESIRVGE